MFRRETTDAFFNEELRVDLVIPVALSCHIEDSLADAFVDEFCDWALDLDPHDEVALFDHLPGLNEFLALSAHDAIEIAYWLCDKKYDGFLVKVSTPVRSYRADGSYTYGWHFTQYTWIYGDTVEHAASRALDWASRMVAGWKAKGGAA